MPILAEQPCLSPGRKVRIQSGPMAGIEGTIVQRRGADRLLIAIAFLQQGVSVEINDFLVDPFWDREVLGNLPRGNWGTVPHTR